MLAQALLLFAIMSALSGIVGTAFFGHPIGGLMVVLHQVIPALFVVVTLAVAAWLRWRPLGYFIGPVAVVAAAVTYCGALYLMSPTDDDDPYGSLGLLFLTMGIPILLLSHGGALFIAASVLKNRNMQRLLGARPPAVVVPAIGPNSKR